MIHRILIMGLPGSGKTTLARELMQELWMQGRTVSHLNADVIRKQNNDWDFSEAGRLRQSVRMREYADNSSNDFVIADFVCPLPAMRVNYDADFIIWVNTIAQGRFADTNAVWVNPDHVDIEVTTQDASHWAGIILEKICPQ